MTAFADLTPGEIASFDALADDYVTLGKRNIIRKAGDSSEQIFILLEGWAATSITLANGKRQIVRLHLPGDIMGAPSLAFQQAVQTIVALTPVKIGRIPLDRLGALFANSPRLAALLYIAAQAERVELMDQLASIGQLEARQRIAAFILTICERLRGAEVDWPRFEVPLTQEEIGALVGLTGVHVNRVLRMLQDDGLIHRELKRFEVLDLEALRTVAALPQREISRNAGWLPA